MALNRNPWRLRGQKLKTKAAKGLKSNYFLQLRNVDNVLYVGDLDLGGQILPVLYDTGSSEIVVESIDCVNCNKSASPMYDQHRSQTFINSGDHVAEHVFGGGPALCQHGLESIRLGDERSPVAADSVPFWQVLNHNISFWDESKDLSGIVGLGPLARAPNLGQSKGGKVYSEDVTFVEALGVNSFAVCLERSAEKSPGWFITGPYVDAVAEKKGFMHVPVVGQFHWAVELTKLQVGGMEVQPSPGLDPCNPSCIAIVDSGTSFIGAPSIVLKQLMPLFHRINKDCSNVDELPDITFNLGGNHISLPSTAYVIKRRGHSTPRTTRITNGHGANREVQRRDGEKLGTNTSIGLNNWGQLTSFAEIETNTDASCMPAFFQMDVDNDHDAPTWILGMPFLRHYYTVFQRNPRTLHIAQATTTCSPVLKSTQGAHQDSAVKVTTLIGSSPEVQVGPLHANIPLLSADVTNLRIATWANDLIGGPHRVQL